MFSPRFIIFSTYLEGLRMFFSTLAHRSHHFAAKSGSTSESARQRCISFTSPDRCPQNRSASGVLILLLICWFGRLWDGYCIRTMAHTHTHIYIYNGYFMVFPKSSGSPSLWLTMDQWRRMDFPRNWRHVGSQQGSNRHLAPAPRWALLFPERRTAPAWRRETTKSWSAHVSSIGQIDVKGPLMI